MNRVIFVLVLVFFAACGQVPEPHVQGSWIKGSEQEKLGAVERQFRGFDMAMVETGYRYQELYWAGYDQNWDYALYQVGKIRKAIKNGLERRPKRAKSAEFFLEVALPDMEKVVLKKDSTLFYSGFEVFTNGCNSCHGLEKVPHFAVKKPLFRPSPIRK
ncbi:MAG TPA: hypothetical protein ENJ82_02750 [Bacteroidetes bacterium]|nr:hypothetical protein [Bacteroidota bacterium]